ncbi:MAG: hypothetical protein B6D64_06705 [Bacteroidetes bacterium 4484_276]|nr:MAG: hypothetical protein B6D64_06705 [Bacteroidetes bacterium 4484_276]
MKRLTFFLIAIIGIGLMSSCEKKEATPVLDMGQATPAGITEPASESQFILAEATADSIMTTFKWSATKYNLDDLEATKYSLQIDLADSNFVNARELVNTTETSFAITESEMNSIVMSMGLEADVAGMVEIRIYSFLNTETDVSELYSDRISMTITPYSGVVEFAKLWVPGDYQGWAPADAPNVFDFDGDGIYNGYIFFPEGGSFEFKFTSDPDWDHTNYGAGVEPGTLDIDAGAGNLIVPGPGGYHLEIDINNLTWNYGDAVENWGVIGEWLAWTDDIDMVYDPINQYLSVTVEDIPAAENQRFKFRANDAWDVNLGSLDPPDGVTLSPGGPDIPIPDGGTITFILRFTGPEPTYEIIK